MSISERRERTLLNILQTSKYNTWILWIILYPWVWQLDRLDRFLTGLKLTKLILKEIDNLKSYIQTKMESIGKINSQLCPNDFTGTS